jgi:flagellar biosynthesis/type III secretory pathway chaperone
MDKYSLFQPLIDALKDETESHARLLDIIRGETRVLRESRLSEVLDIGIRKGDAFRQAEAATQRRVEAVAKIGAHLGLENPVSFMRLAACADAQTRQILTDHRGNFTDIIRNIETANETNRQIIALTLDHVSHHIHFIQLLTASQPNYDQYGQINAGSSQGGLISQAG